MMKLNQRGKNFSLPLVDKILILHGREQLIRSSKKIKINQNYSSFHDIVMLNFSLTSQKQKSLRLSSALSSFPLEVTFTG